MLSLIRNWQPPGHGVAEHTTVGCLQGGYVMMGEQQRSFTNPLITADGPGDEVLVLGLPTNNSPSSCDTLARHWVVGLGKEAPPNLPSADRQIHRDRLDGTVWRFAASLAPTTAGGPGAWAPTIAFLAFKSSSTPKSPRWSATDVLMAVDSQ